MSNLSNITLADVISNATTLGRADGQGTNSRHELAIQVADAASSGAIDTSTKSDDVKHIWSAFQQGRIAASFSTDAKEQSDASYKVQVSKLRTIAVVGVHPSGNGPDVMRRTLDVARDMRSSGSTKLSVFDAMVQVARRQNDNETAFGDDEIRFALTPEGNDKEVTEASSLEAVIKALKKHIDGAESKDGKDGRPPFPSEEAHKALGFLQGRLADITPRSDQAVAALLSAGYTPAQARAMVSKTSPANRIAA